METVEFILIQKDYDYVFVYFARGKVCMIPSPKR